MYGGRVDVEICVDARMRSRTRLRANILRHQKLPMQKQFVSIRNQLISQDGSNDLRMSLIVFRKLFIIL